MFCRTKSRRNYLELLHENHSIDDTEVNYTPSYHSLTQMAILTTHSNEHLQNQAQQQVDTTSTLRNWLLRFLAYNMNNLATTLQS
jgi:hypothetical protein